MGHLRGRSFFVPQAPICFFMLTPFQIDDVMAAVRTIQESRPHLRVNPGDIREALQTLSSCRAEPSALQAAARAVGGGDVEAACTCLDSDVRGGKRKRARQLRASGVLRAFGGQTEQALACYHKAVAANPRDATVRAFLAEALFMTGDKAEAADVADKAVFLARQGPGKLWMKFLPGSRTRALARARRLKGKLRCEHGDMKAAAEECFAALDLFQHLGARREVARTLEFLGEIFRLSHDPPYAAQLFQAALEIFSECGERASMADCYTGLGLVHLAKEDLESSRHYLGRALRLEERMDRQGGEADVRMHLGVVARLAARMETARDHFNRALSQNRKLRRPAGEAAAAEALARLHLSAGEMNPAMEMARTACQAYERAGDASGHADGAALLAEVSAARGDKEAAQRHWADAIRKNEHLDRPEALANVYGACGLFFLDAGQPETAREMFEKSFAVEVRLRRFRGVAADLANLGLAHWRGGRQSRARILWKKAEALFNHLGDTREAENIARWRCVQQSR